MLPMEARMYHSESGHEPLSLYLRRSISAGLVLVAMSNLFCSVSSGPRARGLWRLAVILALITLIALALSGTIESLQSGALMMFPALLLAVLMLARPYTGERVIARLCNHHRKHRRASGSSAPAIRLRPRMLVARGGRLIAVAMAWRGPPPALAGCR
jgi:hypothetical protein